LHLAMGPNEYLIAQNMWVSGNKFHIVPSLILLTLRLQARQ
jgi:hypothetical protein